ncbi:MAG: CIA30 family protein [Gammaproteobacteria bacterium]|nr:CIA30 family protein [Gammaproteobacteria bacterium]
MLRLIFLLIFSTGLSSQPLNDPDDWRGITDQVMGGVSDLSIMHSDGVFFMTGNVSTDNNGGFVRLSNRVDINSNDFTGIKFKAKGNTETYEIHVTLKGLKIPPWSYFSQSFEVNNDWQEHEIFFKDLKRSSGFSASLMKAKNIRDISIGGFGRDFEVELAIKDISLISN